MNVKDPKDGGLQKEREIFVNAVYHPNCTNNSNKNMNKKPKETFEDLRIKVMMKKKEVGSTR